MTVRSPVGRRRPPKHETATCRSNSHQPLARPPSAGQAEAPTTATIGNTLSSAVCSSTPRINNEWKLRYIPIDGETDDHGGSVQLHSTPALDEFQHGEAVTIDGHIDAADGTPGGYAPKYLVDSIRRQGA